MTVDVHVSVSDSGVYLSALAPKVLWLHSSSAGVCTWAKESKKNDENTKKHTFNDPTIQTKTPIQELMRFFFKKKKQYTAPPKPFREHLSPPLRWQPPGRPMSGSFMRSFFRAPRAAPGMMAWSELGELLGVLWFSEGFFFCFWFVCYTKNNPFCPRKLGEKGVCFVWWSLGKSPFFLPLALWLTGGLMEHGFWCCSGGFNQVAGSNGFWRKTQNAQKKSTFCGQRND